MVNIGLIVIASVSAVFAGWHIGRSQHYKKKWKELKAQYTERCVELTNAHGEITNAHESELTYQPFERLNRKLLKDNSEYMFLCSHGFLNLKADVDFQINSDEGYGVVAVMGTILEIDKKFIVKVFTYELNDPSDREFAIRQAEELIEIIQNF